MEDIGSREPIPHNGSGNLERNWLIAFSLGDVLLSLVLALSPQSWILNLPVSINSIVEFVLVGIVAWLFVDYVKRSR